jgi:hypothetical protein
MIAVGARSASELGEILACGTSLTMAVVFCTCLIRWTWPIAVRGFRESCASIDQSLTNPVSRFLSKLQPFVGLFAVIIAQLSSFNRLAMARDVAFADVFWHSMQLVTVVGILPALCLAIVVIVLEKVHPRIGD